MKKDIDLTRLRLDIPFQDSTFTVAVAQYDMEGHRVIGRGIARRSVKDVFDAQMGRTIAEGRAIDAVKAKLEGKVIRHPFKG